jgi:peroxiredoxin
MAKHCHLNFDDPAPDGEIMTADGKKLRLSSLWAGKPLLLAFSRHFGCTQCKVMLDQLRENHQWIEEANLTFAIITQGGPKRRVHSTPNLPRARCVCATLSAASTMPMAWSAAT